jgi:hypothetical protein
MREGHGMKRLLSSAIFAGLLLSDPLLAAIDGTVVNGSTGKPQAGVEVTLLKPGAQGMQQLGTTQSDAAGHFHFEHDQPGGGPQLLQANFKDVHYNTLLTPNMPTTGVNLPIYNVTKSAEGTSEAQHLLVLQPSQSEIAVDETLIIDNPSKTTYSNNTEGSMRFFLPPPANGQVRVSAIGPEGMPLPQAPEKTAKANIYQVNFPIKPGQTQFQLTYVLPVGSPFTFRGAVVNVKGMRTSPLRLVAPDGVSLSGNAVQRVGQEPNTRATIFNVVANGNFSVDITGTGSLPGQQNGNSSDAAATTPDSDEPPVTEAPPKIYQHLPWLVTLALGILALGLVTLFRGSPRLPKQGIDAGARRSDA